MTRAELIAELRKPTSHQWIGTMQAAANMLEADGDLLVEIDTNLPAFEDDPVAMALGFTPPKDGVLLPGTPEHCHRCALDELARWHAKCDEAGLPHDPDALVRHHRGTGMVIGAANAQADLIELRALLAELAAYERPSEIPVPSDLWDRLQKAVRS